jgi:N-dimethylarginine dimethylaminohydrolase
MIPPTYFSIDYSINHWMDQNAEVDRKLAQKQWENLFNTYKDLGASVDSFVPVKDLPDQVFPGDSIFVLGQEALLSHFSVAQRAVEVEPMAKRFREKGLTIHSLPEGINFEGNAEAIRWNKRILAGYGVRSDKAAHTYLSDTLGVEVISLEIKRPFFHLDMCVCPLNENMLAYVPDAFTNESRNRIEEIGADLISISLDEAMILACNSMVVENTVILSTQHARNFAKNVNSEGFDVVELDLSEFAKSGGGAKCLTLEAYPKISK